MRICTREGARDEREKEEEMKKLTVCLPSSFTNPLSWLNPTKYISSGSGSELSATSFSWFEIHRSCAC